MTALARAQMAKLAAEIEQSMPSLEWDSNPVLKKFRATVKLKDGEKKLSFEQMVDKFTDLRNEINFREGILDKLKEEMQTAMDVAGEESVMCIGYPVNVITKKGSRKVNAQKLVARGVSADLIAECTDVSEGSRYVQVGKPKKD